MMKKLISGLVLLAMLACLVLPAAAAEPTALPMTVAEAEEYIAQGQFAPGSMLPKVEACIEYVRAFPEGKALITSLECAAAGLEGKTGTVITA